ncbi:MAG: 30S ribosomal protein S6 [Candidatus Goldiibacteriota bacterium]
MKAYEAVMYLKPTLSEEEIASVVEKIKKGVADLNGEIKDIKPHEKRVLPFEMKKFPDAFHMFMKFEMDASAVNEFGTKLRLTEDIIRHMISNAVEIKPVEKKRTKEEPAGEASAPAAGNTPEAPNEEVKEEKKETAKEEEKEAVKEEIKESLNKDTKEA